MWHCERAGCSEPPTLLLSVDLNGRVIYWDPLAAARRVGTALCFAHASAVPAPSGWVVCDRRGPNPMILVPPIQPTSVRLRSEPDEFTGEEPWSPATPRPDLRVIATAEPEAEPEEWFEPGVGWDDPLDGDDDNTVVVAARRPSRVQYQARPRPPRLIPEVSEPADLRWDLRSEPSATDADADADAADDVEAVERPVQASHGPAGDRPWWADPNELVDLSVQPGPQTPLLARAFRGAGPGASDRNGNRPATATYSATAQHLGDDDDITAAPLGPRPVLPARITRRRRFH